MTEQRASKQKCELCEQGRVRDQYGWHDSPHADHQWVRCTNWQWPEVKPEQPSSKQKGPERIWSCKVGGPTDFFQKAADIPMRNAIAKAFRDVTGLEPEFIFSGWAAELTEGERAVVENRAPKLCEIDNPHVYECKHCGIGPTIPGPSHEPPAAPATPDELARDIERKFMVAVMEADDAFQKAGATGTKSWIRDFLLGRLEAHGLGIGVKDHIRQLRASQPPPARYIVPANGTDCAVCGKSPVAHIGDKWLCPPPPSDDLAKVASLVPDQWPGGDVFKIGGVLFVRFDDALAAIRRTALGPSLTKECSPVEGRRDPSRVIPAESDSGINAGSTPAGASTSGEKSEPMGDAAHARCDEVAQSSDPALCGKLPSPATPGETSGGHEQ